MRKLIYFLMFVNSSLFSADFSLHQGDFFLELDLVRGSLYPNRQLHQFLVGTLNNKLGENYASLEDIDRLGKVVHFCMIGQSGCSFFSDAVRRYLVTIPCRFCAPGQSHTMIANSQEQNEENLETILSINELALLELLTQKILDIVPPCSTVITLGRSPILLGHMLKIGAHLGFRHAAMLNVVHLHFSGKPFSTINFDQPNSSASPLTPEEYDFYFEYLNKQNFSFSTKELYIVDVLSMGQSMSSFLKVFSSFWQQKFSSKMPKIKILNMLITTDSVNDFIELDLENSIKDKYGAYSYVSIDPKPWLQNVEIMDLVTEDLLDLTAKEALEKVKKSVDISQTIQPDDREFFKLFDRLINDDLQQAGGIYFPNKYWNDSDSKRLFNKEVSVPGRLHMQQIINLVHAMHLYNIPLDEQNLGIYFQRFEATLDKLKHFLQINAFRRIDYQIPEHVDFQPIGVKRKGY